MMHSNTVVMLIISTTSTARMRSPMCLFNLWPFRTARVFWFSFRCAKSFFVAVIDGLDAHRYDSLLIDGHAAWTLRSADANCPALMWRRFFICAARVSALRARLSVSIGSRPLIPRRFSSGPGGRANCISAERAPARRRDVVIALVRGEYRPLGRLLMDDAPAWTVLQRAQRRSRDRAAWGFSSSGEGSTAVETRAK